MGENNSFTVKESFLSFVSDAFALSQDNFVYKSAKTSGGYKLIPLLLLPRFLTLLKSDQVPT